MRNIDQIEAKVKSIDKSKSNLITNYLRLMDLLLCFENNQFLVNEGFN